MKDVRATLHRLEHSQFARQIPIETSIAVDSLSPSETEVLVKWIGNLPSSSYLKLKELILPLANSDRWTGLSAKRVAELLRAADLSGKTELSCLEIKWPAWTLASRLFKKNFGTIDCLPSSR